MKKRCLNKWCGEEYEVDEDELAHLGKFGVDAAPQRCPNCRHQIRACFKGSLVFYRRKSALSGKDIISIYSPQQPFPVYAIDEWWSDAWDGLDYGRNAGLQSDLFSQFKALHDSVPKIANYNHKIENAEYSAYAGNGRNAYYCDVAYGSQDVLYCDTVTGGCENLCDCLRCFKNSSRLYECVQCHNCHDSTFLHLCVESRDCHYCIDCRGCSDCLFCSNLRNKQYYVKNRRVSKTEFERLKAAAVDGRFSTMQENLAAWKEVLASAAWRDLQFTNVEDCTGDDLANSAHCRECYYCVNTLGGRYCLDLGASKQNVDSMDVTSAGIGELLYNCTGLGGGNYFMRMCVVTRECSHCTYCIDCYSCHDCFFCTGLRGKRFCIFNKQYSEGDYRALADKIADKMKREGIWGEFFPLSISPFGYNDSLAIKWFPLNFEEAQERGFRWTEIPEQHAGESTSGQSLPDCIDDAPDDVSRQVLVCQSTGRKYKITSQELAFYRAMRLPLPRYHADFRMSERRRALNPLRHWERTCSGCRKPIVTSFAPGRLEKVFCEDCYIRQLD